MSTKMTSWSMLGICGTIGVVTYVKPAKNMQQAIKNCPNDFAQADWEWLVKEHFYSKEFIVSYPITA
jgi:hypothetical protein